MVSSEGVKRLCGYRYVSLKLNGCEGVSQRAVLSLISTSYNLNYLEACGLRECDYPQLLEQVSRVYHRNKTNFSTALRTQNGCSWPATWARCSSSTSWPTSRTSPAPRASPIARWRSCSATSPASTGSTSVPSLPRRLLRGAAQRHRGLHRRPLPAAQEALPQEVPQPHRQPGR